MAFNQEKNEIRCLKTDVILAIKEGPAEWYSEVFVNNCEIKTKSKRTPFSLTHLAAVEVVKQCERFDVENLLSIYIVIAHHDIQIKVGIDMKRRTFDIKKIIKHFIHKKRHSDFIGFEYYHQLKLNPLPFCWICHEYLVDNFFKIPSRCDCLVCQYIFLNAIPNCISYERNGHCHEH